MAFLKHVGLKPTMADCVAGTNLVWVGDQTLEVPDALVGKFMPHPDVWQLVTNLDGDPLDDAPPPAPALAPAPAAPVRGGGKQFSQPLADDEPWTIVDADTPDSPVDLDTMDLRGLRIFALENALDVSQGLNTEVTRRAVLAAALAKPYTTPA